MGDGIIVEERRLGQEQSWLSQSRADDKRTEMANEGLPAVRIGPVIESVSREFACAVDWLSGRCACVEGCTRLLITENDVGLHQGRYIRLTAAPVGNTLRVTGGYYDDFFQPVTVCEKSLPLTRLNERTLGDVFMETHDKLTRVSARKRLLSRGSNGVTGHPRPVNSQDDSSGISQPRPARRRERHWAEECVLVRD